MRILTGFELYQKLGQIRDSASSLLSESPSPYSDAERPAGPVIWLHVGKYDQLREFANFISEFKSDHPETHVIATYPIASSDPQKLEGILAHMPIPDESPSAARAFLDHWRPEICIWNSNRARPIIIAQAAKRGTALIYTNADISKEQSRNAWLKRQFHGAYLNKFDRILAKSDSAAENLRRFNPPKNRLEVLGELTSGGVALPNEEELRAKYAAQIGARPVWLASHVALNEIANLAKAQRRVSRVAQRLLLLLHLEDPSTINAAKNRLTTLGLRAGIDGQDRLDDCDIWIVSDKIGLGTLYRLAPVAYLGQSFANGGGSDPFEAAALGSAIISGPDIRNHKDSYARLRDVGGAIRVRNSDQLSEELARMMSPDVAAEMAHAAWTISSASAEVSDRLIELIQERLARKA